MTRHAILFFLFVLFVAAQEIAVRLAMPDFNPSNHIRFVEESGERPTLGPRNKSFRQIKNTGDFNVPVRFNELGLRESKSLRTAKSSDWFLVGDSYPFGWGVDEKDRVSEQLARELGHSVFNISTSGSVETYRKLVDYTKANGIQVNNLIVVITMENDLVDYSASSTPGSANVGHQKKSGGMFRRVKSFLSQYSAVYFLLTTYIHNTPFLRKVAVSAGFLVPNEEGVKTPKESEKALGSTVKLLQRIANGRRVLIVINPSRALWFGSKTSLADSIHRRFIGLLADRGLAYVDLREAFETGSDIEGLYFKNDAHWSVLGHARAAKAISMAISRDVLP